MNKQKNIFKISNYDKFKCIADKCNFTCCEGWDINIDNNTYDRWKKIKGDSKYLLHNVKKVTRESKCLINKKTYESCPFLDDKGLCYIVKNHGENYLSRTCHIFPRIENEFEDRIELSLSCACPEVVNIISSINGKINMIKENNSSNNEGDLLELKIRDILINIVKQNNLRLEYKLIIAFEMMLSTLDNEIFNNEEEILKELEKYKKRGHIENLISEYKEVVLTLDESVEEINYLFLDIIKNYKEVPMFKSILQDISEVGEKANFGVLSKKWEKFRALFEEHDNFIENCIVSKIFSNCVSDDIEDMAISFQMIVLDYLLVRYALFLKFCINEKEIVDVQDVKDYIVAFSRIIGNNVEAVKEFLADGFGDVILEIGYLCFISLF